MSELYEQIESSDKITRERAARSLGDVRTKTALRALLDTAKNDPEKDVRKAAIDSIEKLGDPEAIPTLEQISNDDRDRGTRNKAKDAANTIRISGSPLPEGEDVGYSAADAERARADARALEGHEAGQAGLYVKLQESLKYRIDRDNFLIDEEGTIVESMRGTGRIEVKNTGNQDRIWAIDATLKNVDEVTFPREEDQEIAVFGNSFAIKELNPQAIQAVPFEFEVGVPKVKLIEDFWDLEKPDSPPIFSRGETTGMRFTLKLSNENNFAIKNVILKKYLGVSTSVSNFQTTQGEISSDSDEKGDLVLWRINQVPANGEAEASCEMSVILSEETIEPYSVGDTIVTYQALETSLSGLNLETITGSSSVFQFISREEQEESPGDFDCQFELENTSEFEMDLKEIRIFEGELSEGNIRLEWLGKDFPEEERSIDPGETFTLDPWTITVEEDGVIPQFGRELDLSVKYLFDAEVSAECVLPGYALPFLGIEASKTFEPLTIPSYRRTEIMTENLIKASGSTEIAYLQVQDQIPVEFEAPEKDSVVIKKRDEQLFDFEFEVREGNLIITMEHLEATSIGTLKQDEEMSVKYPYYATATPDEEFMGNVTILANIYPQVKPVTTEAEAGPISVIHERRKIKIGKMVRSTMNEDLNEYEITIRGENEGTAIIRNVEISDYLPPGFELASETEEEPVVGYEEASSVKGGTALRWIFTEVKPDQKVQIRFKIRAPGDHDPKDVYKMLLG
ncbi:MAG: HEAT repeat domain-containing protein [Candidatus Hodarchaeota archaeon]